MLNQVLQEIKFAQSALNLSDLSRKLGVERSALDGMIQFWVRKGRLRDDDADLAMVTMLYRFKGFGHFVMETFATRIDYTPAI